MRTIDDDLLEIAKLAVIKEWQLISQEHEEEFKIAKLRQQFGSLANVALELGLDEEPPLPDIKLSKKTELSNRKYNETLGSLSMLRFLEQVEDEYPDLLTSNYTYQIHNIYGTKYDEMLSAKFNFGRYTFFFNKDDNEIKFLDSYTLDDTADSKTIENNYYLLDGRNSESFEYFKKMILELLEELTC